MSSILHRFGTLVHIAVIAILVMFGTMQLSAQHDDHETKQNAEPWQEEVEKHEFAAGDMIIEHITDSYEWHLITAFDTHYAIPLPIMLYDEGKFHFFMSSVFHHGPTHEGYFISHHEMNEGKLVSLDANGEEIRPTLDFSFTKNVLAIFLSVFFMIFVFLSVAKAYKRREGKAPKGLQ
ncbi:MAG: hypothetical protein HQ521_14170, partial [Bacteroidetes bacterium]|nr:hypothetical protein [Bacteroidota bacterium]